METLYHFFRWLKELDLIQVLLYLCMPLLVSVFILDWFREFLRPHR
jgi:hypothetical protein